MKRGLLLLLGAVLLVAGRAAAEDASVQEDMRFIEELRKRGDSDLALEYLERLQKTASPELAKALPLEVARTRLEAAGQQPDSAKRLALYGDARDEFQKWLAANPADPRAGEVKLDLAHVTVQQGRTQLSRAFLNEEFETKVTPEALQARTIFEDAGAQLTEAAKNLKDKNRIQADFDVALNEFDQAQTYPLGADPTSAIAKTRNDMYAKAQKDFEAIGVKDDANPVCWKAKAWAGRCMDMLNDVPKAKARYQQIFGADKKYAGEAQRLTRYFYLLLLDELPSDLKAKDEDDAGVIRRAKEWIAENPGLLRSSEGYGIRFLLGKKYEDLARAEKDPVKRAADLSDARRYYKQVEESENDFTDRARRNKVAIIAAEPGFKGPIEQLKNFEECYVRAQYELMEQAKAEKDAKTPEDVEKARQSYDAVVTSALERGLKLADESKRGDEGLELANAKAMIAYQYMNAKKYHEAIAVGEKLAKGDPHASQAAATSVYVLQSYAEMVGQEEAKDPAPPELKADRKSLFDFAHYMEKTWPKEAAGDMARHQLALLYINAKIDPDDPDPVKRHAANVQEAIKSLASINPTYGNRTVTQYQLAQFCFGADKEKLPPLEGEAEGDYRKRALAALRDVPPWTPGADPTTSQAYFMAKARLAQEDFGDKNYDEMEALTQTLLPQLSGAVLDADPAKDQARHAEFEASIKGFQMYARWAKADLEAQAAAKAAPKDKGAHYAKVVELLNPIVDDIAAGKHPELRNNPTLQNGILDNALRATIQVNQPDRTRAVLNGYKALAPADATDAGAAEVLKKLVAFLPPGLEEMKHKGDAAALEAARKNFGDILADTIKPLQGDKMTPALTYYTARIYSSMDRHKEAADLLEKVPDPGADPQDDKTKMYQTVRLQLVRERRMNGEAAEARKVLDEILGDAKKPGWGRKEIPALIENIEVVAAGEDYKSAAELANGLAQKLLPNIETNPRLKEIYLQLEYMVVENVYRQAVKVKATNPNRSAELVKTAANLTVELARKQLGFVTDATRDRFRDLMDAEPDLKTAFLDAYVPAVEAMEKQAEAVQVVNEQRDRPMRDKAFSDAASLIVELEKLWPDDGNADAQGRITKLRTNTELQAAYDKQKGTPATP